VSAFEPQLPTDPKVDMPDFMVVLRGFDRRQVEMWAAEVAHQIEQERQRADEAEKRAYRVQIENKGAPSFSHLGTHVASILEEAGKSSENMLADAAERAQETVEAAEEDAAEIIKAAEHRAGEIEGEARRTLEEASSEGARVEEEALQAAEEMRAQAEQDARTVLEEARDATDMIWQEAERERLGVEAETIRLETLRHRSLEQLGRVYGHLESVLDEVRAGIGRVEDETEDLDEATAAAAARLGVEPPASSPEESPRFPAPRDARPPEGGDDGDGLGLRDGDDGDGLGLRDGDDGDGLGQPEGDGGDGMLASTRPDTPPAPEDAEATQPVPASVTAETTQPTLPGGAAETTQPDPAVAAAETPAGDDEGAAGDQDATQRLEPVGNAANKARSARPDAAKDDKGQP
jgi:cell division septum initiation protein DivIVA